MTELTSRNHAAHDHRITSKLKSTNMSEESSSRDKSAPSNKTSQVSLQNGRNSTNSGRAFPGRMSFGPRQTNVSIFTGLTDGRASPHEVHRSDGADVSLSPGAVDRVFPIRSAVSIDHSATPIGKGESAEGFPSMRVAENGNGGDRRFSSRRSERTISPAATDRSSAAGRQVSPVPRRDSAAFSTPETAASLSDAGDRRRSSDATNSTTMANGTHNRVDNHTLNTILSDDAASYKSGKNSSASGGAPLRSNTAASIRSDMEAPLVTARFKHVVTDGGHAVITGRDGETLQRCEDEPIHIPGAVQSFGLLVAFREEEGKLIVHVVSENSAEIIGYSPAQLFRLNNFLDIFTEEQADNLLDHLDFIRDEEAADVVANGPEVFMLSVRPPQHRTRKLWCAMHVCEGDKETIICEFEIEDDVNNPLTPVGSETPEPPEDTLGSDPTPEELAESTVNISKPLRVLRSARKKRGEAAAMEVFNIMSQVQEQLANAPSLSVFLKVLIGVVKELTGFHRVMIYQFDQSWNGRVVSELVDPRATKDLYKGLNFPASDIPKQARDMYKLNKVRLLYDRDQETSRLVCRTVEDLENPLDLTHAYLRAMSPIHIKYLGNMAVRSSMSISINAFNELWGLIACHSYGSKGMRVSFPIRKMCRLVGDTASRNIERLSYASRLQARKLINTTSSSANPSGYIVASSEDLLKLFDADVGALSIRDETKIMGNPSGHLQEILAMVEFLRLRRINTVLASQDIRMDFPDLRYEPGLKFLAGVLYVPLSQSGNDFIAFFRRGVLQEVKWAGNPYEKFVKEGTEGYLEPRKSFKTWSETIVGRCRDWTEEEIETSSVLCLVYGKFIDVWRQKEAALQNSQLTRLLLANSAHEVRTPLNAIINYLEIALEGHLDSETRENLAKSHSASKSLVYVINDLLDLTKTEENKNLVKEESFDLHASLREATDPYVGDAKRKGIEYIVEISDDVPRKVLGDPRRVRQIVSNLIANAVQHTATGSVRVGAWLVMEQLTPDRCEVEISVEDTGAGMSSEKVDALFQELEEVSYESDGDPQKLLDSNPFQPVNSSSPQLPGRAALGLGLAVVARTVRNMNGQLRLKTEEGKGSRFIIALAFNLDGIMDEDSAHYSNKSTIGAPSPGRVTPGPPDGEITLVNRDTTRSIDSNRGIDTTSLMRKKSADSMNSLASLKSGKSGKSGRSTSSINSNRSDADRLIDAIQEPLRFSSEERFNSGNSRGARRTLSRSHSAGDSTPQIENQKSRSIGSTRDFKTSIQKVPGQQRVVDSGTPIKPVRVPDVGMERGSESRHTGPKVAFAEPEKVKDITGTEPEQEELSTSNFSILVAEDDPINSKIMKKRLEKMGHRAYMTVNGEECASAHGEQASSFDAVLMDLQMPIVDGFGSTKMIRSFEKTQPDSCLSLRANMNGRIPIFAVSASLEERERDKYIETGFDGWILKPVDFKRVELMLHGIIQDESRNECLYTKGKWEQGGWFEKRQESKDMFGVNTEPSQKAPTNQSHAMVRDDSDDVGQSEGSPTPTHTPSLLKAETV